MIKDMEKVSLFWGIIWAIVCAVCLIGIFWNPAQIVMTCISGIMSVMFFAEYYDDKKSKK